MDDLSVAVVIALLGIVLAYFLKSAPPQKHKRSRSLSAKRGAGLRANADNEEDHTDDDDDEERVVVTQPHEVDFVLIMLECPGGSSSRRVQYQVGDRDLMRTKSSRDLPWYPAIGDGDTGWAPQRVSTTGNLGITISQEVKSKARWVSMIFPLVLLSQVCGSEPANRHHKGDAPIPFHIKSVTVYCYIPPHQSIYMIHSVVTR